jgi:uncharacterized protein YndB with AHSA1/START domain
MTQTDRETTHEMTLTRILDATPEEVWQAWTTPEGFSGWFGAGPYRTPQDSVSMNVTPGGDWRATQVSEKDGSELPFAGHYREVDEPERLVMTFDNVDDPNDQKVEVLTVELRSVQGGTEMVVRQAGHLPGEQYGLLKQGYGMFFDRMEVLLGGR